MFKVKLNNTTEWFNNIDEMIYYLRINYNIDLSEVNMCDQSRMNDLIGTSLNEVDQIGVEPIEEEISELYELLSELKTTSKNKEKLNKYEESINYKLKELDRHITIALESLVEFRDFM